MFSNWLAIGYTQMRHFVKHQTTDQILCGLRLQQTSREFVTEDCFYLLVRVFFPLFSIIPAFAAQALVTFVVFFPKISMSLDETLPRWSE